jgi:arginyl-tRNA--protein-N-Asp/Glu arginylyltransferase
MKLLFSEAPADYEHYVFPYAVWAFPEPGETAADLFSQGFLPSSRELDRFYLCRQVRIHLPEFRPSSENRRILRKGAGISHRLLPRGEFNYTPERRDFYKSYADTRFGQGKMSHERLDSLFAAKVTSHLLLFFENLSGKEVGAVTLYLEPPRLAYYYYAFYDLAFLNRNLGMFMMTSAVGLLAGKGFEFLYLGSCYSPNALYKTQFTGAQFFNGVRWSTNLEELKYLVARQDNTCHLLESDYYRREFCGGGLDELLSTTRFRIPIG